MEIYDPDNLPPTIPAQHTVTLGSPSVVVSHDMAAARNERNESIIAGYEGSLRNIQSRAQEGIAETDPVRMAMYFAMITSLATLALRGGAIDPTQTPDERTDIDES